MNLLRDKSFLVTGLSHLAVDLLNSTTSVLLAFLSIPLGLTNTLIGLFSAIYSLTGSLSQPIFGFLADRIGVRPLAFFGVLWMAAMFGLAVVVEGQIALLFLILAALGSGAFHPAGTMEATLRGRDHLSGKETTAASIFFLFGEGGFTIGPAVAGPLLEQFGPQGLLLLLLFVVPVGIGARVYIPIRHEIRETESEQQPVQNIAKSLIVAFVILVAFRSWAQINMITFLPKYFSDLGYRPGVYGFIAALFMAGSATGGVLGGWLGDRFSKRNIVVISLLTGAIPLFLFPLLSTTSFVYVLTLLAGFFTGIPHSILVIIAQRLLPGKIGMASGIILGFTFASGSLGTLLSGIQADFFGFDAVFLTTASISLIAGLMAIPLDKLSSVSIINT